MTVRLHECVSGIEQFELCVGSLPVTDSSADTCRCDEKADIFSYGVVVWELITQQPPRRGRLRELQVLLSSIKHDKAGLSVTNFPLNATKTAAEADSADLMAE